jgi:hypothetical protein
MSTGAAMAGPTSRARATAFSTSGARCMGLPPGVQPCENGRGGGQSQRSLHHDSPSQFSRKRDGGRCGAHPSHCMGQGAPRHTHHTQAHPTHTACTPAGTHHSERKGHVVWAREPLCRAEVTQHSAVVVGDHDVVQLQVQVHHGVAVQV